MIDHDRLFKELLTTFFPEFLDLFVPDLSAHLDRQSIAFLDKEVFTDVTAGATHRADLVARARHRGEESFFLVHLEHQAQPRAGFAQRMFGYFAALYARHHLRVYPIALFSHDCLQPEPDKYRVNQGPAGWWRARKLSGRRLRGSSGLGISARLDCGNLNRRNQRGDHRRQRAGTPCPALADLLAGDHCPDETLAICSRRATGGLAT